MVDWSTLPSDLLGRVGNCFLATSDFDYYTAMRAVCHDWRSANPGDPLPAGAVDPRFRSRHWIMLEEEPKENDEDEDTRLFVNLSTGRFLRRRVPQLRDHFLVTSTSDGLLVLGSDSYPHAACVLNPFTGSSLRFAAPLPINGTSGHVIAAVTTDHDPTMLFVFDLGSPNHGANVTCADPSSECFVEQRHFDGPFDLSSMVSHAGHVYLAGKNGKVFVRAVGAGTMERLSTGELLSEVSDLITLVPSAGEAAAEDFDGVSFLVDSASEVLLVRRSTLGAMEVSRVDLEKKALEPTKNIGGRGALFLGDRCLSVDADMFPSVDADFIYHYTAGMYRHDLRDGKEEKISGALFAGCETYNARPFSLVQLLLIYCNVLPDVQAELIRLKRAFKAFLRAWFVSGGFSQDHA